MTVINQADAVYLGDKSVDAIYAGATKVWPAEAWSPADLPGLTIWLDASQLDEGVLTSWPNLAWPAQPGAFVGIPAPVVRPNVNNIPIVGFTANEGRMRIYNTGIGYAFTLIYVCRMLGHPGRIATSVYPPSNLLVGYWNGYEDVAYTTNGTFFLPDTKTAWTSNWRMYSADAAAPPNYYPRLFKDGVLLGAGGADGTAGAGDGWQGSFSLSGYDANAPDETCDCEVAEVLLYDHKLSDTDRNNAEGYLRDKWMP